MFSKDEEKDLKLLFWKKLENRTRRIPGQKGKKRKWIGDHTDVKGVDLRFDVNRKRAIVALEINSRDKERRFKLFEKLMACQTIFENAFELPLEWDPAYNKDGEKEVARVYCEMPGDMLVQEQWPELMRFLIDRMIRMENAFLEVQDFLKYDALGQ